jgi:ParB family transcriptional regulator, chromosome partitioning protein
MSIENIPLSQLVPSPRNVRKTGGASIESLAASIHAHGLLQNLTVSPGPNGTYAVEAGSRRLRALQHLVKVGQLLDTYPVPCQVRDTIGVAEISLAENVMRHAMHPADEFDAFAQLAAEGLTVGEISARFGQSELFVKQRLKLANVASEILDDYRAGNATLEQMMAMALTDDKALQARIWKGARSDWQRDPDRLRKAITEKEFSTDSRLGKFIGLAAYEKAGGTVRRDMFAEDGEAFMQDAELVARLCTEKLERSVAKLLKDGWLWAEGREKFDYTDERAFGTVYPSYKGGKETWSDDVKATAGAIVTIDYNGKTEIKRGLVRAQDRKAAATASGDKEIKGGKKINVPGELSFAAVQRLQAEATGILQAEIAELPRTALALLAAELAGRALYSSNMLRDGSDDHQRQWVHIQREHSGRMPGNLRDVIPQSASGKRFAEAEKAWKERLPKKKSELRDWLLQQDFDTIAKLLAFLAARELDLVDFSAGQKQGAVDLAEAAQVDLSQHWAPSEEWLATLPKSVVVEMVASASGNLAAMPLGKMKRDQLPKAAIALLPKGWLPKPLRPKAPAKAATKKPAAKKAAKPARAAKVKQ